MEKPSVSVEVRTISLSVIYTNPMLQAQGLAVDLKPRRLQFEPRTVHVGLLVGKVVQGQVFSEYFIFPLPVSFRRSSVLIFSCKGKDKLAEPRDLPAN
jgi:hypothetical protein